MGFLYEQEETDTHTVIRYTRYVPGFVILIVAYMLVWFLFQSPAGVAIVAGLGMFVIFRDQRAVRRMLLPAHKEGRVIRSGRSLSMGNPLTFTIEKTAQQRRSTPRGPHKGTQRTKKKSR
jgi:hypothetical protein